MRKVKEKILSINLKKIIQSNFFKDTSYMVLSTIVMQLIAIGTIPILTRLFSPEAFGFHATYRSTLIILSILLTLKLETAIVLPKNEKEKNIIYNSSIVNVLIISILITIIYFALKIFQIDLLEKIFKKSTYLLFGFIITGSILVSFTNINQNRLVSLKKFKTIAVSRIILPTSFFVISIILYYYSYNYNYASLIFSQFLAYLFLYLFLQKNIQLNFKGFNKKIYFKTLKKYKDIIKYTSSNALINTISLNIPALMLLNLYGAKFLGYYAIGAKLISIPTQLVGSSFSQVFYKKSVDIYNYNKLNLFPFVKKVMFSLLIIGSVTFIIAYFLIPYIVPFFLGKEWNESIKIMQYLCIWQALMIVNGPVSSLTIILNKQKNLLFFQITFLIARIISIWLPYHLGFEAIYSILFFALTGLFFNAFLFIYLLLIAKKVK